jgi:putative tryptophan/tyrosine transport system substrate-binding protein
MIRRRAILQAAAALATGHAALARAEPQRIAWLGVTRAIDGSLFLDELRGGLREFGHVEGRELTIDAHWGEDSPERVAALAAEIVAGNPRVVVAQGGAALALRRAMAQMPVVFGYSGDPVEAGLVDSLARPGRNMTGLSYLTLELVGKRMEMLKELLPAARRVAVLANPQHPGDQAERRASQTAADALGLSLAYFEARGSAQVIEALAAIADARVDAVMMFPVQAVISNRAQIAEWAIGTRIPAVSGWAQFAQGGNLLSYGPNLRNASRRLAAYVDRILKGAKPADMPVELPTQVELVVNLRAAKALGVDVPVGFLARADEVIE